MKLRNIMFSAGIVGAVAVSISLAVDSKKDDVYSCKAVRQTSIECSRSNTDCVSKTDSNSEEILLTNPRSLSPRIMRAHGSGAYNLKRLSVTKDSKAFYLATTGDMGGMSFYLWLPDSSNFFEIKAHRMFGDFSSTVLYQCQNK